MAIEIDWIYEDKPIRGYLQIWNIRLTREPPSNISPAPTNKFFAEIEYYILMGNKPVTRGTHGIEYLPETCGPNLWAWAYNVLKSSLPNIGNVNDV